MTGPRHPLSAVRLAAWAGLIVLAAILAMGPALSNGFVYDDVPAILENAKVHSLDLPRIVGSPYWTSTLYRPVTTSTLALLWQVGGGAALPFHLANLALAVLVSAVLLAVLLRLKIGFPAALVATLLFTVHPVHVEVVANGVGLAELLSALFLLSGVLLALAPTLSRHFPLSLGVLGLAALLSKESGITILALIPLLWLSRGQTTDADQRQLHRRGWLMLLLCLLLGLALRTAVLGTLAGEAPIRALAALDLWGRLRTGLGLIPEWARLLLWPASLQADYGPPQIPVGGPLGWRHTAGLGMLVAWGAATFMAYRRGWTVVLIGLIWIPVTLSPVANVLFPTGLLVAERTLFLPSVGVALIVAGLLDLVPGRDRIVAMALMLMLVGFGAARSNSRSQVWHDQERFFSQMVIDGARSYRSWYTAGSYFGRSGDPDKARRFLGRSWQLYQGDFRVAEEYGQALRAAGDLDAAVEVFRAGHALDPDQEPLTSRLLETLMSLGLWEEAEALVANAESRSTADGERLRRRLLERRNAAPVPVPAPNAH